MLGDFRFWAKETSYRGLNETLNSFLDVSSTYALMQILLLLCSKQYVAIADRICRC